jgi:acetyl esterase/lipase
MCDFSEYDIPSEEWLLLASTLPPTPDMSAEELKKATNAARAVAAVNLMKQLDLTSKVAIQDHLIPARDGDQIEARTYRSIVSSSNAKEKLPIYMHFHGGGSLYGSLESEDPLCSIVAIKLNILVLHINWNDSEVAMVWLCKNASNINADLNQIVIGGSSAVGQLAASLIRIVTTELSQLQLSPQPTILGQDLMIPSLVFADCYEPQMHQIKNSSLWSYNQCVEANFLDSKTRKMFNDALKVNNPDPNDKRLNPGHLTAEEAKRMPPTTFGIAGYDPFQDEGLLYAKLLTEQG